MELKFFFLRLLAALLAGLLIGAERQWHHKNAGLRTNTLVAIGSAIYVLLSIQMTAETGDVTRIVGQVVTGVGFLGAGVILHEGMSIHGMSTAATIWCSSAVGCLAAAGFFAETAVCTSIIIVINVLFLQLEKRIK